MNPNFNEDEFLQELNSLINSDEVDITSMMKLMARFFLYFCKTFMNGPQIQQQMKFQKDIINKIDINIKEITEKINSINTLLLSIQDDQKNIIQGQRMNENIFEACKEGKLETVKWLIENAYIKKDIKAEKNNSKLNVYEGDTPIHAATINGHLSIVKYLIEEQNVDINIQGWHERSPLHYACENDHILIVDYLLSHGADIEGKDISRKTPLHFAANCGKKRIVQCLLSHGANREARDKNNHTPSELTCDGDIQQLLSSP